MANGNGLNGNDKSKDLVSISQAALILGVSIDTVRRWDKAGTLSSSRPDGKNRYFSVDELEKTKLEQPLTISEAARTLKISPSTLRRLEDKGLISPIRNGHGERLYDRHTLEKFLDSEYFIRQKEVEEEVLEPLKAAPTIEEAEPQINQPGVEFAIKRLVSEHHINIHKLREHLGLALGVSAAVLLPLIILVGVLTTAFLVNPESTAKKLSLDYRSIAGSGNAPTAVKAASTGRIQSSSEPLSSNKLYAPNSGWKDNLRPFVNVALFFVKVMDTQKYATATQDIKISDVNSIFQPDKNGGIQSLYTLSLDSSKLSINDQGLVFNLNSDLVQGKRPGTNSGDLAVLPVSGGPGGEIVDDSITTFDIANGSITGEKLAPGLKLNSGVSNTTIVSGGSSISDIIAGNGLLGGGSSGSVSLSVAAGNGISLIGGAVSINLTTIGSTATTSSNSGLEVSPGGLRLIGGCSDSQVLKWNAVSEQWFCATVSGGSGSLTVEESDGSPVVGSVGTIQFGPASSSSDEFIVTDQGSGSVRITIGNQIAKLDADQTFTGVNTFSNSGNSFTGDGSGLTALDASNISGGTIDDSLLSTNVTLQGNTFNGASQLVQLTAGGLLPILDGSNLTNINASYLNGQTDSYYTDASNISGGTLDDLRLSANVTLQGNTFNGASQLVKLTAGGLLPILSGANLTSLNASNISSGTLNDTFLSTNVTVQGNSFNSASQLVQLTAGGLLPVLNGSNLTNVNVSFNNVTAATNTNALVIGTGGSLAISGTGTIAATSTPFSGVTASTNTAALVVGTGGSLATSGTGTITATALTANYVANANTSTLTGLTGGSAGSNAASLSLALDESTALSGDVSLAANNEIFGQNGLIFEGSVADTNETFIAVTNPTADHTFTFPDVASGNVCISNVACIATSGTASSVPFSGVAAGTNTNALVIGTGGSLAISGTGTIAATSTPFSGVTASTNTAALVVGTGGSLATSGTGTITATDVNCTDCVALTTETTGNYVANVANGTGITGGSAGSEGAALTLAIDTAASLTWTGNETFTPSGTNNTTVNGDNDSNMQVTNTFTGTGPSQTALAVTLTDNATAAGTSYGLSVTNADNGANVGVPAALAYLKNANAAETVADGLLVEQTGAGTLTSGLEVKQTAGAITNGLTFTGTFSKLINSATFNVSNAGGLTGVATLDTITASATGLTFAGAGTISSTGSNALTLTGAPLNLNNSGSGATNLGTSTNTGAVTIGNTSGTFQLISASGGLNVSTTGALTGVASIDTITHTATTITFAGAGTISSTGANALALSSSNALNLTGASPSTWSIGAGNALTITSSNFNTTSTGINSTAIGATTASTGRFTTLTETALLVSNAAPTISSGFGTSPSISSNNGTAAFRINVGTGGSATSGVIGLPTAANGWNCYATDITTNSTGVFYTKQTASSTTTATIGNFSDVAVATAWTASNILAVSCFAY